MKFETKGHIAIFTLNRPKARNAVNYELAKQFEAHLEKFESDTNLWYLVSELLLVNGKCIWNY